MRKARVLFLLLLVLVGGAYAALYGLRSGWFKPSGVDQGDGSSVLAPSDARSAAIRPSFDIVRAEPDGSVIMAGRAEPGWTVTVESAGKAVGQAVADSNGEWVVEPTRKLSKGEHALELRAQNAEGGRTLFSKQRLALSLSDPKRDQPLVALTEEGKSTRVLQMPPPPSEQAEIVVPDQPGAASATLAAPQERPASKDAAAGSGRVGFASVDYEDAEEKSMLHMSGQAAPGTRVMLYVDEQFNGIATSDATGSWSFSGNKKLTPGSHILRADLLDKDTTKVVARAEVKFDRTPPSNIALADDGAKKEAAAVAASPATSTVSVAGRKNEATAAGDSATPGSGTGSGSAKTGAVIVVRSGDTLWQIAQRHYGNGAKYTQIFKSNRQQIRNPNWIYPSQKFEIPQ
jgi:nucleoid-associated protein YgaU